MRIKLIILKSISIVCCLKLILFVLPIYAMNEKHIEAKSYLAFDRETKQVVWGKNINEKMPMASTTKIMTGILTIEYGNLEEIVTISKNAQNTSGWQLNLREGDKIKLKDLLYAIMLYSANDGAIAIAEHIGGSVQNFCSMMNKKAKEIGAYNTNFTSPHGLDNPQHYSSAYDIALIADYALNNSFFREIVKTTSYNIHINNNSRIINNTNKLLMEDENIIGIKTGYTGNAMYCLVSGIKNNDTEIISVVLGANTSKKRFEESKKILDYTKENYIKIDLNNYIKQDIDIKVEKGKYENIKVYPNNSKKIFINKNDKNDIQVRYMILEKIKLPIKKEEVIALATVYIKNEKICSIEYTTKDDIEKNSIRYYHKYLLQNYVNLLKIYY